MTCRISLPPITTLGRCMTISACRTAISPFPASAWAFPGKRMEASGSLYVRLGFKDEKDSAPGRGPRAEFAPLRVGAFPSGRVRLCLGFLNHSRKDGLLIAAAAAISPAGRKSLLSSGLPGFLLMVKGKMAVSYYDTALAGVKELLYQWEDGAFRLVP